MLWAGTGRRLGGFWLLCLAALVSSLLDSISIAQTESDDFEEHYQRGKELAKAGKFQDAVREYEAAERIEHISTLALNIGLLYLQLDQPEQAQHWCRQYLTEEASAANMATRKAEDCMQKANAQLAARKPKPVTTPSVRQQPGLARAESAPSRNKPPVSATREPTDATQGVGPPLQPAPSIPAAVGGTASEQPTARIPNVAPTAEVRSLSQPGPLGSSSLTAQLPAPGKRTKEKRPIYKEWWFWTVIGMGAAGVVVGITAGLVPSKGDLLSMAPDGNHLQVEF